MIVRGTILLAFAGLWATTPAFGQWLNTYDESSYSTPNQYGNITAYPRISYYGWLLGAQMSGDIDLGAYDIPGGVMPAYTDCNCNSQTGSTVTGYGSMLIYTTLHYPLEEDPNEYWIVDAVLMMTSGGVASSDCEACPNCDGATDYTPLYEYYGDVYFEVEIGN